MFGRKFPLFKIFGFQISIDLSWLLIAFLVTWSLAAGVFPSYLKGLSPVQYWAMAIGGALGFFLSIIFHEFWHSLVARHRGLPMNGITLFVFGGVAEMGGEPESPKTELLVAAAGPAASIVIGLVFYLVGRWGEGLGWAPTITVVLGYLGFINWILAGFNLLPAFPLDGGRILRSTLWHWRKDLRWATKIAARTGGVFGLVLFAVGALNFIGGNLVGGIWYFLIGMFLRGAASMSYRQVLLRQTIGGKRVRDLMSTQPVGVDPDATLQDLVENVIYRHHFKMIPVLRDGDLLGCVTTRQVREVPREEWPRRRVADILHHCSSDNTIDPDADIMQAYEKLRRTGQSRLMVMRDGRLEGILALKDIVGFLTVRLELEDEGRAVPGR